MDSNHRRRSQQIYSLPHLATLVLPRTRAENWNRTSDLLITSQLLYQLSYFGIFGVAFTKNVTFPQKRSANVGIIFDCVKKYLKKTLKIVFFFLQVILK